MIFLYFKTLCSKFYFYIIKIIYFILLLYSLTYLILGIEQGDMKQKVKDVCFRPEDSSHVECIYLDHSTAYKLLLFARLCSAMWCHITDCDETYNYWEPVS